MRPTNMQRVTDNDGRKLNQSASPSGRPKHTTTITVLSSARSSPKPVSLTSPLQSRLSGDLSQILESRDEGAAESVQSLRWRYSRNVAPSRVALPDHPRGSTQMWSAVSSATSPQSLAQASSTKSPQVTAASVKTAPLEASAAPELLRHTNSKSYSISRSSSDADSSSPDRTAVRSNGHYTSSTTTSNSDDCGESDTSSVPELDFFSSLPSLPADDFMSPVAQQYASLSLSSPSEASFSTPSSPSSVNIPISTPTQREDSIATAMAAEDETDPTSAPPAEIGNPALDSTIPGDPHSAYKSEIELPTLDGTIPYDPRQASKPEAQTPVVAETALNEEDDEQMGAAGIPPESFHINVKASDGESLDPGIAEDDITSFAGRRDVRDHLRSKKDRQIVSTKGTVRGFKNRVRAGIATFIDKASNKFNYHALERGKIVLYATSMTVVRETFDRCKAARNILQNHMVRFEQRDVYMNSDHQRQLRERLDATGDVSLPQVFIDGDHLGGATELEKLNESGELRKLLQKFPKIQVRRTCDTCGGYRYVPCRVCNGSKKSVHRNNFTEEFCALRCMHCDGNGLQRCRDCFDKQE